MKTLPHPTTSWRSKSGVLQAIVTPDAVHCGVCRPSGNPITLELLDT